MKKFRRCMPALFPALLGALLLLAARPAVADTARQPPDRLCAGGIVSGTVKDGSGTGLFNATVLAEEEFTEMTATVTSGFDGQYDLCLPPAGTASLSRLRVF